MADDAGGTLYPVDVLRAFTLRAFKTAGVPDADGDLRAGRVRGDEEGTAAGGGHPDR